MNTTQQVVGALCADGGAGWLKIAAYVGGVMGAAGLLSNFKNKLPPRLAAVLQLLSGQAIHALELWAKAAPVILIAIALGLAACANQIAQVQSDIQTVNTNLTTIIQDANTDVATFAADDLPGICSFTATLNSDFGTAASISGTVNAQAATEAAVYQGVQQFCAAGAQVTNVASAVVAVKTAAQQIQAAIKATQ